MGRWIPRILAGILLWSLGSGAALGQDPQAAVTEVLLRVKPAVVIILTDVSAEVLMSCGDSPPERIAPSSIQSHGTGYLVSPTGFVATNGHVVQRYHEKNEKQLADLFIRRAIAKACLPEGLSEAERDAAIQRAFPKIAPDAKVQVKKTLHVLLANRNKYVAEVKAFSPPLSPEPGKLVGTGEAQAEEAGKDVAILKIEDRNLPTIPLGDSDRVQLGEDIRIVGFPGVVLYHDLLGQKSAVEASITSGHVSSLKTDVRGGSVIQTDAAASWGNSGGPAINSRGEVVGMITFISLTTGPGPAQAIQGFNFLVPVNTVKEFLRAANVDTAQESPFSKVWADGLRLYFGGDYSGALGRFESANRIVPNMPDVLKLQAEAQLKALQAPMWRRTPLVIGAVAVVAILGVGSALYLRRRAARPAPYVEAIPVTPTARALPTQPAEIEATPLLRLTPAQLAEFMRQGSGDFIVLDVRKDRDYTARPRRVPGALRVAPEELEERCATLPRDREIVAYCD